MNDDATDYSFLLMCLHLFSHAYISKILQWAWVTFVSRKHADYFAVKKAEHCRMKIRGMENAVGMNTWYVGCPFHGV